MKKRCSDCKIEQPIEAFPRNRTRADGRSYICRKCAHARGARYRAAHPDETRVRHAAYHAAHAVEIEAARVNRRAMNPEKTRAAAAAYHASHRAEILARSAAWDREHPESSRARTAQHRARKLAGFVEDVALASLVARDHGRCGICGKPVAPKDRSVDHILPLSRGGQHSYANTRLAHRLCNISRSNRGSAQLRLVG